MRPILKYRGGKLREIPYFQAYIPKEYDTYIEPFLGGGAVYFYLEPEKAIINDINPRLMEFYTAVAENYGNMRVELDEIEQLYETNQSEYLLRKSDNPSVRIENKNEDLYYMIRDMYNDIIPKKYLDAVIYYVINKTAYSGMIRFNNKGEYNVPFGRYAHLNTNILTNNHSDLLKQASIYCTDYSNIFDLASENDFMFLDPPYDCVFHDYGNAQSSIFNESDHIRLAEDFRELNCKALMVIGKTDFIEELYSDLITDRYSKNYSVNIRNRFKNVAEHLVIMNY